MTYLTDLIEEGKITPAQKMDPVAGIIWWAYFHQNGTVQVKRWWPPEAEEMCNLEYTRQEKENGNNLILYLLDKPFLSSQNLKLSRAIELIKEQLKRDKLRVVRNNLSTRLYTLEPYNYGDTQERRALSQSRFSSLDLD